MRKIFYTSFLLAATLLSSPAAAAPPPAPAQPPLEIHGITAEGKPFDLSSLRGKVVQLMFWSTDCAVCRNKMPELRLNYQGWQGQPFELVTVSVDQRHEDVQTCERLIELLVPMQQRFVQLWRGDPNYQDNVDIPSLLPLTYLIDKQGRTAAIYHGRIPAETWDQIADLL